MQLIGRTEVIADNLNPIPVWGDGTELRDLLFIDDFIQALQLVIEKQETYNVFNVGCNDVYSVNDVLAIMKRLVNNTNPIEYVKGKPSMIPTRRINSNKIKDVLGWEATTPLEEGLLKAYNWYLANKDEFK
jgi:GDP-L-fucose synthase